MQRRRLRLSIALLAAGIVSAACGGGNPADTGDNGGDGAAAAVSVGLAFDVGGRNDKSFNDAAYAGLQQALDESIIEPGNAQFLEANQTGSNRSDNMVNLAEQGSDLVVPVGFAFSPDVDEIAPDFQDTFFAVVDGFACLEKPCENVSNLTFKEHEGSFLVGAAAAMKSETGTIGFLGGQEGTGIIEKFEAGYVAGAQEINPDIEVLVEYIGDSTQAFVDPTKGEALSAKMYDAGADVVYHAAGQSGSGLFRAAVASDKLAIGVDSDQSLTIPSAREVILTSMLKRVDTAVHDAIQQVADDSFKSGTQVFGLAEEGVGFAVNQYNDNEQLLSKDIQSELNDLQEQIISGDIKVPDKP